jgi:hypothetical protein
VNIVDSAGRVIGGFETIETFAAIERGSATDHVARTVAGVSTPLRKHGKAPDTGKPAAMAKDDRQNPGENPGLLTMTL